jgi:hypothetical protein
MRSFDRLNRPGQRGGFCHTAVRVRARTGGQPALAARCALHLQQLQRNADGRGESYADLLIFPNLLSPLPPRPEGPEVRGSDKVGLPTSRGDGKLAGHVALDIVKACPSDVRVS